MNRLHSIASIASRSANSSYEGHRIERKFAICALAFAALLFSSHAHAQACSANPGGDPGKTCAGAGNPINVMVLVVDAVAGAEMEGVSIHDDLGWEIYSSAVVARKNRSIMAVSSGRMPLTVRAIWGKSRHYDFSHATWYGGTILGDYTIPVAERIPDAVLSAIRAQGGNLRLKFRLKPEGVLFGWDIERASPLGNVSIFEMPGGDFVETKY